MHKHFLFLIAVISIILSGCKPAQPTPEEELASATVTYKETTLAYLAELDSVYATMNEDNAQAVMDEVNRLESQINEAFFAWQAVILTSAQKAFGVSSEEELAALGMDATNDWIKANVETDEMLSFIEETEIRRLTILDKAELRLEQLTQND